MKPHLDLQIKAFEAFLVLRALCLILGTLNQGILFLGSYGSQGRSHRARNPEHFNISNSEVTLGVDPKVTQKQLKNNMSPSLVTF